MATATSIAYRRPWFNPGDGLFNRCLTASFTVGLVFLAAVLITPIREQIITRIEQLPPRFAKLIVDKPGPDLGSRGELGKQPGAPGEPGPGPKGTPPGEPGPIANAAPVPASPGPLASGPAEGGAPGPGAGAAGRARAQSVVAAQLVSTTSSLQKSLEGLSASLSSAGHSGPGPSVGRVGPGRAVRLGRDVGQLTLARTSVGNAGGAADLGGSTVAGSWVTVGALSGVGGGGGGGGGSGAGGGSGSDGTGGGGGGGGSGAGGGGGGGGGTGTGGGGGGGGAGGTSAAWGRGSAPGVYRSNASLLAVIQKYAAGIQYCYGNELKREPGLRGKLVVALTVAASGDVIEATIVQNTVGSERLSSCALSQIRSWKFPPIAEGTTTFQAPFVFTPPN